MVCLLLSGSVPTGPADALHFRPLANDDPRPQGHSAETELRNRAQGQPAGTELRNRVQGQSSRTELKNSVQGQPAGTELRVSLQDQSVGTERKNRVPLDCLDYVGD